MSNELYWVGLAFDSEKPSNERERVILKCLATTIATKGRILNSGQEAGGMCVVRYTFPTFGTVAWIYDRDDRPYRCIGFGIPVANRTEGKALVGRANRILGFCGINEEATLYVEATPKPLKMD